MMNMEGLKAAALNAGENWFEFEKALTPEVVLALIAECERLKAGVSGDMAEIARLQAEYDRQFRRAHEARTAHQQELERHRKTWRQLEQAQREMEGLRADAEYERAHYIAYDAVVNCVRRECKGAEVGPARLQRMFLLAHMQAQILAQTMLDRGHLEPVEGKPGIGLVPAEKEPTQ